MATIVNMHEAKTHLSKLVAKAMAGEETIIALSGKPAAKLVPLDTETSRPKRLGFLQGLPYNVPDDIKTPFKKDIDSIFHGNQNKFKLKAK